jgi:predicted  nucleic acid-binding Zn-ribbon protein
VKAPNLAHEVANASRVDILESEFRQAKRDTNDVVNSARRLARLQAKRVKLRRELRAVEADIKHERKMLRALAGADRGGR